MDNSFAKTLGEIRGGECLAELGAELQNLVEAVAYSIDARLRWRLKERVLTLWYELVKPHLVVRDALTQIADEITSTTGIKPLNGQEN